MENFDVLPPVPAVSEDVPTQTPEPLPAAPVVRTTPPKGSQTPTENLYAALAEERRKRQEAEDKLINVTAAPSEEVSEVSVEVQSLKHTLETVATEVSALREEREMDKVYAEFPVLKEHATEFNEFRSSEHPRAKPGSVAKLFLAEKGLLEVPRPGLENPTGGPKTPPQAGMTVDEIKTLRETNYRSYADKVKKGEIKI